MKLWFISLLATSCLAQAEIPSLGAASLSTIREDLSWQAVGYQDQELLLERMGQPLNFRGMDLGLELDQETLSALYPTLNRGDILFARVRLEGSIVRIRFTGAKEALDEMSEEWTSRHDLSRFIKGVWVRWVARYTTDVMIHRPWVIDNLRAVCNPGAPVVPTCEELADLTFNTAPQCLRDPNKRLELLNAIEIEDPFLGAKDERVSVTALTSDICRNRHQSEPWIQGASGELIFGQRSTYDRLTISRPSSIKVKGEIRW